MATIRNQEVGALRDQLGTAVARSMQEMARTSEEAKRGRKRNQGIWYPLDYIKALGAGNPTRYNYLREKGHLVNGWMPNQFFVPIYSPIGPNTFRRRAWSFLAKKDVLPTDAIEAAKQGLSILDCGATCQIARYDALLQVLGAEKFNRLFGSAHGQRINVDYEIDDEMQPMRYFVDFTLAVKNQAPSTLDQRLIQVGQLVLFGGVPKYYQKHLSGMGANYNVICSDATFGRQRYVGHGLPSEGVSEEELALLMVREYNAKPDHYSRVPKEAIGQMEEIVEQGRVDTLANDRISEKTPLSRVRGFDPNSSQDFCIELIKDLIELPVNRVSIDYVKTHPKAIRERIYSTSEIMWALNRE